MYTIRFSLPGTPQLPNRRNNRNWKAGWAEGKKWKEWVCLKVGISKPPTPLTRAQVICTRLSSVAPDRDNLYASFKPVIDGLRLAGVIQNDRIQDIDLVCDWKAAPKLMGCIIVEVKELEA